MKMTVPCGVRHNPHRLDSTRALLDHWLVYYCCYKGDPQHSQGAPSHPLSFRNPQWQLWALGVLGKLAWSRNLSIP